MLQCVDGFTNEFNCANCDFAVCAINAHIGIYEFNVKKHYATKPRQNRGGYIRNSTIILH